MTEQRPAPTVYAGLVTRAIAIAIDLGIANLLAVVTLAVLGVIRSALGFSGSVELAGILAGALGWFVWLGVYFSTFWTITGQTPGDRLLGIRVVSESGGAVKFRYAVRRFFAMVLCAIPLGAGFIPVLFDDRRRGYHDRAAGTVVRWVQREDVLPPVEPAIQAEAIEAEVIAARTADAVPLPRPTRRRRATPDAGGSQLARTLAFSAANSSSVRLARVVHRREPLQPLEPVLRRIRILVRGVAGPAPHRVHGSGSPRAQSV